MKAFRKNSWLMGRGRMLACGVLLLSLASHVHAAPVIQGVTGANVDGGTVSITGSGFGSTGPNLFLYDTFEHPGVESSTIPLSSPVIGQWATTNLYPATYDSGRLKGSSMRTFTSGVGMHQLKARFPTTSEVFLSYWVKLQNGFFPNTSAPYTFPTSSSWKLAWIMNGDDGYRGQDDLCLPSFIDGRNFAITGNGSSFMMRTGNIDTNRWFSFDNWMRISVYLKGGLPDPAVDPGIAWFQALNGAVQKTFSSATQPVMGGNFNGNPRGWTQINFPGWLNGGVTQSTRPTYDDVYIAIGPNARARVEIGNAPTYGSCTHLTLATINAWSDTTINATLRTAVWQGQTGYVYVADANGVVNNDGYPVTIRNITPPVPGNLRVLPNK